MDSHCLVRLEGFEPPTPGSEDQCSNPLSYRRLRRKESYQIAKRFSHDSAMQELAANGAVSVLRCPRDSAMRACEVPWSRYSVEGTLIC